MGSLGLVSPSQFWYLCQKELGSEVEVFMKARLHMGECWNAVRCHRRLLSDNRTMLDASDLFIHSAPGDWRRDVLPLLASDGKRAATARRAAKQRIVEEERTYNNREEVEEHLIMNIRQYKKHMKDIEDLNSGDASNEFLHDLNVVQGCAHSTKREPRVAVVIKKIRIVKGVSTSTATQPTLDDGGTAKAASPHCPGS